MRFPRFRTILYSFVIFLLLVCVSLFLVLQSDRFWQWAGPRLVKMANEQIRGTLTVGKITGNPFSGYSFRDIELTSPQGKVFEAKELELRVSFFSLLALRPSLRLALTKPKLTLEQDQKGQWNVTQLLPPREGPPGKVTLPVSAIHLSPLVITDGEVTLRQPGGIKQYRNLDLDLAVTLSNPLTAHQSLRVKKLAVGVTTPWGRYSLASRFSLSESLVEVASLVLKSDGHPLLSLSGRLPLTGKREKMQMTGDIGPIPGAIAARFSPKWPAAWGAGGKFQIAGPLNKVQVTLTGKVHQATFSLQGVLSQVKETWHYDVVLRLADVKPEMLAVLDAARAKEYEKATPFSARLHLKGSGLGWPPRQFAWNLQIDPVTYGEAKLEQGQVTLEGTDKQQKLAGLLKGNFGSLSVRAEGSFLRAPRGEVTVQTEEFKPGLFGLGVPQGSSFTGKFAGKVAVPDVAKPERVSVAGDLQVSGRVGEHPLKELRGRFAWEKPKLTIHEFRAQLGNLLAELQGTLDGDRVNFTHRGKTMPGGAWPVPAELGGSLSWEGAVTGRVQEPAYTLQLRGQALSWETFALKSLALRAKGEGLPPRSGTADLTAKGVKTPAGTFSQVTLASQGGGDRWRFTFKASSPPKGPQAELAGTADLGPRPMALMLERLRVDVLGVSVKNQETVQVRFSPGLELQPATFQVNGGTVTAQASLQGNQISSRLSVRDLPVEISRVKGLHGKIQAQLSLEGSASNPVMESEISLVSGKWGEFSFQTVKTTLNYSNTSLTFAGGLEERGKAGRLTWNGNIPLRFSLMPFQFALLDEDVDIKLWGDGANLAMATIFTEEVQKADATLNLQVDVKGRLKQPQITGQLRWGDGQITLRQAGTPYRLEPGSIRLENNKVTLPQLTLKSKGTTRVTADIELAGFEPQRVTARAQFDNFKALGKLGSEAFVNGIINLTGPWSALVLQGQLTIPQASLNPALLKQNGTELPTDYVLVGTQAARKRRAEATALPGPYQNMEIAVDLEGSRDVWIIDKMAKVKLALDIRIKKKPGEAVLVGGLVRSLKGNIDVYGKEFTLEKGLVNLPGVPGQEPYLEARAVHKMTDATFIVDVTGPVNNPKIDLSSSPPMPPNDLLSYLIFDRPASSLNKGEFDVTQQAVGVLGGITARKIQEFLGKDFPVLGDVNIKASQGTIGVTKPLTKGVTLSLERKLSPTEGDDPVQLRLQYRINRHLSLEAERGQSRTGADALFNFEF